MIKMGKFLIAALCGILLVSMAFVSPVTAHKSGMIEKLQGKYAQESLLEFLRYGSGSSGIIWYIILWIIYLGLRYLDFAERYGRTPGDDNDGIRSLSV